MPTKIVVPDPPFFDTALLEKVTHKGSIGLKIYRDLAVDPEQLQQRIVDADIAIVDILSRYNEKSLSKSTRLKHLVSASVALNHIDLAYCRAHDIQVHNFASYNSRAVAEMAFANLVSLLRHVPYANQAVRSNLWLTDYFEGEELKGKRLGVIGAGNIGKELIAIGQGFGMRIFCHTKNPSQQRAEALGIGKFYSLRQTLQTCDFVILAVSSNEETEGMISEQSLKLMRRGSYVINMGRQYLIDTKSLARALYRQEIAGAALDFVGDEPYAVFRDDPEIQEMINRPNVIVTPHIGFNTKEAASRLASEVSKLVADLIH